MERTGRLATAFVKELGLGAPLARLELETTLAELLRTEPELEILAGAARRPTFQFRGWARLPIAIHA